MNFLKTNWLSMIAIALFLFIIFFRMGSCNNNKPVVTRDTVFITDTQYVAGPVIEVPEYVPVPVQTEAPEGIPPKYVPSEDIDSLKRQYNNLLAKHLATNTYNDSISLKDSIGERIGYVSIRDRISENTIKNRNVTYQVNHKVITNTQTITIREPYIPRNQVYAGIGLTGTPAQIVNGAKAEVLLKNKKDHMYGIEGGGMSINGKIQPVYGVKALWKIKLR